MNTEQEEAKAKKTEIEEKPLKKLSRDEINELPLGRYEGDIQLINSDADLKSALASIRSESLLGFDTETRPVFKKGQSYPPALLQLATSDCVFIFQLKKLGYPNALIDILSSAEHMKSGVALDFDVKELQKVMTFEPSGFIELSHLAKEKGIGNNGLRGLTAYLLGFRISKRVKTSNWDREELSESQIIYAATDAWVSREIYLKLLQIDP